MSTIVEEFDMEYELEQNEDVYDAIETVFEYSAGRELSFDQVYSFVKDTGDRGSTWEALNELSTTSYLSAELDHENTDFVYSKE